mmetsp:Transcript_17939/g.44795  ORF Transcript_17939/g.44795 Transcript_17939/m.44795 type:complete len:235 (-) Transcript_17939:179-883(-)
MGESFAVCFRAAHAVGFPHSMLWIPTLKKIGVRDRVQEFRHVRVVCRRSAGVGQRFGDEIRVQQLPVAREPGLEHRRCDSHVRTGQRVHHLPANLVKRTGLGREDRVIRRRAAVHVLQQLVELVLGSGQVDLGPDFLRGRVLDRAGSSRGVRPQQPRLPPLLHVLLVRIHIHHIEIRHFCVVRRQDELPSFSIRLVFGYRREDEQPKMPFLLQHDGAFSGPEPAGIGAVQHLRF